MFGPHTFYPHKKEFTIMPPGAKAPEVKAPVAKSYQVGDKLFHQQKLVMGQVEHLSKRLADLGSINMDKAAIAKMFSERLDILAVVLIPDGKTRADVVKLCDQPNGLAETIEHLRLNMDWDLALEVASDFFVCNPISSLLTALEKVVSSVDLTKMMKKAGSKASMPASVEVIQLDAAMSGKI